jgi:hypothetical protein
MVRFADRLTDALLPPAKEPANSEGRAPAGLPYCTAPSLEIELQPDFSSFMGDPLPRSYTIAFLLGLVLGIGVAQAADETFTKPTYKEN